MHNKDIRQEITKARIRFYEVAAKLGMTDSTLSRKLRYELSDEEKSKIRQTINEIRESEM